MQPDDQRQDENGELEQDGNNNRIGLGIALGVAIGTAIGVIMDNIAMGIGIGVAIGIALGLAMSDLAKWTDKSGEDTSSTDES